MAGAQSEQDTDITSALPHPFHFTGWNEFSFNSSFSAITQPFTETRHHEAGIRGISAISSNSLTLAFSVAALSNDFIDDDLKNAVSDQLSAMNVFEYNTGGEIFYRFLSPHFLGGTPALLSFSLRAGSVQHSKFTNDLFNLAFYGNAGFAGSTADFSGTKGLLYDFRQLRFGVQKKFAGATSAWEAGFGASLLLAKNGSEVNVYEGSLFTEANGEYIDALYDFHYMQSDTGNKGTLQVDGTGAAADLMLAWSPVEGHSKISFYINDLGWIGWNKHTNMYKADSSVHFEGIEVTDFLFGGDGTLFQFSQDSILSLTGTTNDPGKYATALPTRFSLVYAQAIAQRWMASGGISYRPSVDLLPFFYVQPVYSFSHWFNGGATLSYGGTAQLQIGLMAQFVWNNMFQVRIASENLSGIMSPDQSTSTSLFLQASIQF